MVRFRVIVAVLAVTAVLFAVPGCKPRSVPGGAAPAVALITDVGGLGDKARNDMLWRGCQRYMEETGARVDLYEPPSAAASVATLKEACEKGVDVVVVASPVLHTTALGEARRFPKTKFILIGGRRAGPNVVAISIPERDCGFLMGVMAAAVVPAGGYGFIGGRDDEPTRDLAAGFAAGVASDAPGSLVSTVYLGSDYGSPLDAVKARGAAETAFEKGAAVVFAAAGAGNAEIAAVAKERTKLVIGYESNQNYLERGYVLTSLNVRWDDVIYDVLNETRGRRFRGGVRTISIASDLITYPVDDNNRNLVPPDALRQVEEARQALSAQGPA